MYRVSVFNKLTKEWNSDEDQYAEMVIPMKLFVMTGIVVFQHFLLVDVAQV